jgi:Tol biopolymer transport system component
VGIPVSPSVPRLRPFGLSSHLNPSARASRQSSSDGNILYVANGAIHIRTAAEDRHMQITDNVGPSGDMPVFTADGSHVVFALPRSGTKGSRSFDLWVVPASGGPPKLFIEEAGGAGFSPDGRYVAYTKYLAGRKALWISPLDKLDQHTEAVPEGFVPRWSPDGRWLAYTTANPNEGDGSCVLHPSGRTRDNREPPAGLLTGGCRCMGLPGLEIAGHSSLRRATQDRTISFGSRSRTAR